jgi:hypothetical protein
MSEYREIKVKISNDRYDEIINIEDWEYDKLENAMENIIEIASAIENGESEITID